MDGILPLWKERGQTSHDCVFKLRKILQTKKVGHGGTLDPDVDGVLPICIGKGTKVIEFITDSGKVYEGEITLGFATTTEDASGEVIEKKAVEKPLSSDEIDEIMGSFIGEIKQIPPMYSAVKVNGKRLYEYARAGQTVERKARKAQIYAFGRSSEPYWDSDKKTMSWRFFVHCGKGTYIRTLAVDTGKKLGFPAHMSDLTRTASGGFTKKEAVTLLTVKEAVEQNRLSEILRPIEYGVREFQQVLIDEKLWEKVRNGMRLPYTAFTLSEMPSKPIAVFYEDQVVSIYAPHEKKEMFLKPVKVLRTNLGEKE